MTRRTPEQTTTWFDERMADLGFTQDTLAQRSGMAAPNISRYRSQKQVPSARMAQQLAAALQVDIVTLFIELGALDPDDPSLPTITITRRGGRAQWTVHP